jgi:hypothetical protein
VNISTNSSQTITQLDPSASLVSHAARRSQHRLDMTLARLFLLHAPENVLLVTCTFAKEIGHRDAMHRFGKLLRKLRQVGSEYLWVFERGHAGHVHFHLLLVVPFDVRQDVDLAAYALIANDRLSAKRKLVNKPTADLWSKVDRWCEEFGIGRTEVAPLYKPHGAIHRYFLKSVSHNWCNRKVAGGPDEDLDKGVSWWSSSRGLKAVHGKFSYVKSPFRQAVRLYGEQNGFEDIDQLKETLGSSWTWVIKDFMEDVGLENIRRMIGPTSLPGGATQAATTAVKPDEITPFSIEPSEALYQLQNDHHAASVIRSQEWCSGPGRRDSEHEMRAEPAKPSATRGSRSPQGTRQRGRELESTPRRRSLQWMQVYHWMKFLSNCREPDHRYLKAKIRIQWTGKCGGRLRIELPEFDPLQMGQKCPKPPLQMGHIRPTS